MNRVIVDIIVKSKGKTKMKEEFCVEIVQTPSQTIKYIDIWKFYYNYYRKWQLLGVKIVMAFIILMSATVVWVTFIIVDIKELFGISGKIYWISWIIFIIISGILQDFRMTFPIWKKANKLQKEKARTKERKVKIYFSDKIEVDFEGEKKIESDYFFLYEGKKAFVLGGVLKIEKVLLSEEENAFLKEQIRKLQNKVPCKICKSF